MSQPTADRSLGMRYDAIVLAGGGSRRMGGGDKTALALGGVPLLERALDAVRTAQQIIVVGPWRETRSPVRWAREDPAGGGPAAALAAGLLAATAPLVVVLAADLPFVTAATVSRLLAHAEPAGVVMMDGAGVPQWLLGGWPTDLLRSVLDGDQSGRSLRGTAGLLSPARLTAGDGLPEWFDCDDPAELVAAKELMDGRAGRLAR